MAMCPDATNSNTCIEHVSIPSQHTEYVWGLDPSQRMSGKVHEESRCSDKATVGATP